jgi:osmotically-inducible protein OsmY
LEGELKWNFQKEAAKKAIKSLLGLTGITDHITIKSETYHDVEKEEIEDALSRNWSINDSNIHVKVNGTRITLTGTVNSWYQKDEAARIAWNAPGVWNVDNELVVEYDHALAN